MYKSDNNKAVSVEAEQKKQPRSSTPPKKQITEREREREKDSIKAKRATAKCKY